MNSNSGEYFLFCSEEFLYVYQPVGTEWGSVWCSVSQIVSWHPDFVDLFPWAAISDEQQCTLIHKQFMFQHNDK